MSTAAKVKADTDKQVFNMIQLLECAKITTWQNMRGINMHQISTEPYREVSGTTLQARGWRWSRVLIGELLNIEV
jgi:hypothetical protein